MPSITPRRIGVTTALIVGSFGASLAFAAWTSDGAGTASSKATSAVALTVAARTATADLYPGFTGGDLFFTVTNPNPYPVTLTAAAFSAIVSDDTVNCPSANVSVLASKAGLSLVVAGGATVDHTIADVVSMAPGAANGCQAKTFTTTLTLTGASSA